MTTKFSLKNSLSSFWQENKQWILLSTGLFTVGFVIGFLAIVFFPSIWDAIQNYLQSSLSKEIETLRSNNNLEAIKLIFTRNLKSLLIISFGGFFFGLSSLGSIFFNGAILGLVVAPFAITGHLLIAIATIVPHGIIEIPALILAGAFGLRLGINWLRDSNQGKRGKVWVHDLVSSLKFLPIMILMLAIAAVIEVMVSGEFAKFIK